MKIACVAFDVDGVLTDGSITYTSHGEELKTFHAQDGLGISLLHRAGIATAIITGRTSPMVERRAKELGMTHVFMGVGNKQESLQTLCESLQCEATDIAYMGDDLNDLPILTQVGHPMAPGNAVRTVQDMVQQRGGYVAKALGGRGAVREGIDYLLQQLGVYDDLVATYQQGPTSLQQ